MTFKPAIWQPIAIVLSVLNIVGVGFAAGSAEPWHAAGHAALGVAFGLWAQRLRRDPGGQPSGGLQALETEMGNRLEVLEGEVGSLGRELSETQERLDFAERLLAQGTEARRVGSERQG